MLQRQQEILLDMKWCCSNFSNPITIFDEYKVSWLPLSNLKFQDKLNITITGKAIITQPLRDACTPFSLTWNQGTEGAVHFVTKTACNFLSYYVIAGSNFKDTRLPVMH